MATVPAEPTGLKICGEYRCHLHCKFGLRRASPLKYDMEPCVSQTLGLHVGTCFKLQGTQQYSSGSLCSLAAI